MDVIETLPQKWARESAELRAKLRKMTREDIADELESCGVHQELIDEISDRMR